MTMWIAVLLACGACFALKFVGYLVPESWVAGERTSRVTTLIPVALLAGLVVVARDPRAGRVAAQEGGQEVIDTHAGHLTGAVGPPD